MATNECIPYYEPGERITGHASTTVTGKRFLKVSGNIQSGPGLNTGTAGGNLQVAPADAGGRAFGVAGYDAASGDKVPVLASPGMIVPVTADGSISAMAEVEVGTGGKAKAKSASGQAVGLCLTAATDGNDAMILLLAGGSAGEPGSGNEYAQGTQVAAIADVIPTATNPDAIVAASGEATAADLTTTQGVETAVSALVVDVAALTTAVNAIIAGLEEFGIAASA